MINYYGENPFHMAGRKCESHTTTRKIDKQQNGKRCANNRGNVVQSFILIYYDYQVLYVNHNFVISREEV